MNIIISNKSDLPIYQQIKEQIKEQILSNQLKEGEPLPSIRTLAKELSVSVITTTRAYTDLESEGYIVTIQGKGTFIAAKDNQLLQEEYLKKIENSLQQAIKDARLANISNEELLMIFNTLLED